MSLKDESEYLKAADPILGAVIAQVTLQPLRLYRNYFESLAVEVINQQLSSKVADVIEARFRQLFGGRNFPEPKVALAMSDEKLRSAGLSRAKISYIKNVARTAEEGKLTHARLDKLSDEEVIATLTTIKGIGRWTAEMFLMFTLGRPDVFSYGDLGLRTALIRLYKLRKAPTPKRAEQISTAWRPYRTLASRYLWEAVENRLNFPLSGGLDNKAAARSILW